MGTLSVTAKILRGDDPIIANKRFLYQQVQGAGVPPPVGPLGDGTTIENEGNWGDLGVPSTPIETGIPSNGNYPLDNNYIFQNARPTGSRSLDFSFPDRIRGRSASLNLRTDTYGTNSESDAFVGTNRYYNCAWAYYALSFFCPILRVYAGHISAAEALASYLHAGVPNGFGASVPVSPGKTVLTRPLTDPASTQGDPHVTAKFTVVWVTDGHSPPHHVEWIESNSAPGDDVGSASGGTYFEATQVTSSATTGGSTVFDTAYVTQVTLDFGTVKQWALRQKTGHPLYCVGYDSATRGSSAMRVDFDASFVFSLTTDEDAYIPAYDGYSNPVQVESDSLTWDGSWSFDVDGEDVVQKVTLQGASSSETTQTSKRTWAPDNDGYYDITSQVVNPSSANEALFGYSIFKVQLFTRPKKARFIVRYGSGRIIARPGWILWQHQQLGRIWSGNVRTGAVEFSDNDGATWTFMSNPWTDIPNAKPLDFEGLPHRAACAIARLDGRIVFRRSADGQTWGTLQDVCPSTNGAWCVRSHATVGLSTLTIRDDAGTTQLKSDDDGKQDSWQPSS